MIEKTIDEIFTERYGPQEISCEEVQANDWVMKFPISLSPIANFLKRVSPWAEGDTQTRRSERRTFVLFVRIIADTMFFDKRSGSILFVFLFARF
jgi:hypothetical protein